MTREQRDAGIEQQSAIGYQPEPPRSEVDKMPGPVLLEFGADWCGYCQKLQAPLAALLKKFPQVQHIKVADGPGRPLGRTFRIKLWPTLVFLRDGHPLFQVSRPEMDQVQQGLDAIVAPAP